MNLQKIPAQCGRCGNKFKEEDSSFFAGVYLGSRSEKIPVGNDYVYVNGNHYGWAYSFIDVDLESPLFTESDKVGAKLITIRRGKTERSYYRRIYAFGCDRGDNSPAANAFIAKCLGSFIKQLNWVPHFQKLTADRELITSVFLYAADERGLLKDSDRWRKRRKDRRGYVGE